MRRPEVFLCPSGVSGQRFCAWSHLKKTLCRISASGEAPDKYLYSKDNFHLTNSVGVHGLVECSCGYESVESA